MEADLASADFLGSTKPVSLKSLAEWEGRFKHTVDIFDEKNQKSGELKYETVFVWEHYTEPKLFDQIDEKSRLKITI